MDARSAEDGEQREPPVEPVLPRRDGDPSSTGTNVAVRNGTWSRAGRASRRTAAAEPLAVSSDSRSRYFRACGTPLGEIEEGHLLLIHPCASVRRQLEPPSHLPQRPPERDIAPLVVADAGLRPDVAEDDVDAPPSTGCISSPATAVRITTPRSGSARNSVATDNGYPSSPTNAITACAKRSSSPASSSGLGFTPSPSEIEDLRRRSVARRFPEERPRRRAPRSPRARRRAQRDAIAEEHVDRGLLHAPERQHTLPAGMEVASSTVASPWMVARRNGLRRPPRRGR